MSRAHTLPPEKERENGKTAENLQAIGVTFFIFLSFVNVSLTSTRVTNLKAHKKAKRNEPDKTLGFQRE